MEISKEIAIEVATRIEHIAELYCHLKFKDRYVESTELIGEKIKIQLNKWRGFEEPLYFTFPIEWITFLDFYDSIETIVANKLKNI